MKHNSETLEKVRKAFKRIMSDYEISNKELSNLSGVSEPQISNYRTGSSAPSLETFLNLINSLPVPAQIDCLDLLFNLKDKIDISRKHQDAPKKTMEVAETSGEYKV